MRVFFAAGGTAGHIYPAIAIAEIIKNKYPSAEFLFAATKGAMEDRLLGEYGFHTTYIHIHGLKHKFSLHNLRVLAELPKAVGDAKKALQTFRPHLVIGTGGYICYPTLRAAQKLGIKTALHESNAVPGLTVKLLASKTDVLMLSFEDAAANFPSHPNCHHVGTPLRDAFGSVNRQKARAALGIPPQQLCILSFGGSLGAQMLNSTCVKLMNELGEQDDGLTWFHATGQKNYANVAESTKLPPNCHLLPYISDMATYMAAADLVICRAGASTLAELSTLGKPSILVPYPHATKQHQLKNALSMQRLGGALVVEENEDFDLRLKEALYTFKVDPQKRNYMGMRARLLQGVNVEQKILSSLGI